MKPIFYALGCCNFQVVAYLNGVKRCSLLTQVEEKPDVTYSDVGGCKEQIEKLREVVEIPMLHVSFPDIVHMFLLLIKYYIDNVVFGIIIAFCSTNMTKYSGSI